MGSANEPIRLIIKHHSSGHNIPYMGLRAPHRAPVLKSALSGRSFFGSFSWEFFCWCYFWCFEQNWIFCFGNFCFFGRSFYWVRFFVIKFNCFIVIFNYFLVVSRYILCKNLAQMNEYYSSNTEYNLNNILVALFTEFAFLLVNSTVFVIILTICMW